VKQIAEQLTRKERNGGKKERKKSDHNNTSGQKESHVSRRRKPDLDLLYKKRRKKNGRKGILAKTTIHLTPKIETWAGKDEKKTNKKGLSSRI